MSFSVPLFASYSPGAVPSSARDAWLRPQAPAPALDGDRDGMPDGMPDGIPHRVSDRVPGSAAPRQRPAVGPASHPASRPASPRPLPTLARLVAELGALRRTPAVPTPPGYRTGYRRTRPARARAPRGEAPEVILTVVVTAGVRIAALGTFGLVATPAGTIFSCLTLRADPRDAAARPEFACVALAERLSGMQVVQTEPATSAALRRLWAARDHERDHARPRDLVG